MDIFLNTVFTVLDLNQFKWLVSFITELVPLIYRNKSRLVHGH